MNITELMQVEPALHDENWLKQALQNAVRLELATIPPYLCALWSIKTDSSAEGYVSGSIREIVFEEMAHLGLVCNMLTALGETPRIFPDAVPVYPGPLPGGVKPGLTVSLRGLSFEQLETFMAIEAPEHPFEPVIEALDLMPAEEFTTIGKFYDAILEAFENLSPVLTGARQLTMSFPKIEVFEINSLDDVRRAVEQIKDQGEGTSQTSPEDSNEPAGLDLAHFYRFREIADGHRLIKNAAGSWIRDPQPLTFPEVYPMADVPPGGYAQSETFDRLYTLLIQTLHSAWENGNQGDLYTASFGQMSALTGEALSLMSIPIPDDPEGRTYGPSFLLLQ